MILDMMWVLKIFVGVVLIYVLLFGFVKKINEWLYVNSLGDEKKHRLPPGDMGWPVLGNMLSFLFLGFKFKSNDPDSFIGNLLRRYGRTGIYKSHLLGSPTIIVTTPELARKVMIDDQGFGPGYPSSTRQLTTDWFHRMTNSEHKLVRRLVKAPINGHEELGMYIKYIEESVISALDEWSSMNEPVEFMGKMEELILKVLTNILFGTNTGKSVMASMVKNYGDLINGLNSAPINIPGFAFHKALKAKNVLFKIFQDVLDKRRAMSDPIHKRGMIDLLMESEDESGKKLADQNIVELLLIFLLAGHESIALAVTWAIIFMHDHPQVLQKAKEEQRQLLKKRPSTQEGLTLNDIREMKYLQKVIDETLRMIADIFSIFREARADINVNGYLMPKGWKVMVWSRAVHMDPEIFPNPKDFIPERWENNTRKAGSFLAFGGGSRICPGADLAKLQASIFLHYFLLNYKLEQINPKGPNIYLPHRKPADNCLAKIMKVVE